MNWRCHDFSPVFRRLHELNYNHNYARRAIHAVTANHESAAFNSRKLKGRVFHYQKTRDNGAIAWFFCFTGQNILNFN